jgi:predicted metal-dependent hydrolase
MATERHFIELGEIHVEIVRKAIKNLHVGVYPPLGRVRVAAPLHLDEESIRLALVSRLGWIRRQQERFLDQERQSQREMVSGESHYFQGKRYRLTVIEQKGNPSVTICSHDILEARVRLGSSREEREAVLDRWYRRQLREQIPKLLAKWEPKIGVTVAEWHIKRMKTRWGTCSTDARRIWLNLELIKKPLYCLEYVLVHELIHLIEPLHSDRFVEWMDKQLPNWRTLREELNRTPLSHTEWKY